MIDFKQWFTGKWELDTAAWVYSVRDMETAFKAGQEAMRSEAIRIVDVKFEPEDYPDNVYEACKQMVAAITALE